MAFESFPSLEYKIERDINMQGKSNRKSVYLRLSRGEAYLLRDDLRKLGHEGEAHFNKQKRHDLICLLEAILDHNSYSY